MRKKIIECGKGGKIVALSSKGFHLGLRIKLTRDRSAEEKHTGPFSLRFRGHAAFTSNEDPKRQTQMLFYQAEQREGILEK